MKNTANESQWCPFRSNAVDLERIAKDVAEIPDIQRKFLVNNADLKFPNRVAHQFQIAGSRVLFQVANDPPEPLLDVGLFEPDAQDHAPKPKPLISPRDFAKRLRDWHAAHCLTQMQACMALGLPLDQPCATTGT